MTSTSRQRPASASPRACRTRSIGELVDIAALEPDGLVVTTGGVYVRVIECQHVPNVISADPSVLAQVESGWAELCAAIPDLQGLSFYAQTDPIGVADAMRDDRPRDVAPRHPMPGAVLAMTLCAGALIASTQWSRYSPAIEPPPRSRASWPSAASNA